MVEGPEFNFTVQQRLGPEDKKEIYYIFPEGAAVWPKGWGPGCWIVSEEGGLQAIKLEREKIDNLQAWKVEQQATLYRDNKWRELSPGKMFGAYAKNARKRTIPPKG